MDTTTTKEYDKSLKDLMDAGDTLARMEKAVQKQRNLLTHTVALRNEAKATLNEVSENFKELCAEEHYARLNE